MAWYVYVAYFFAGCFLANSVPHFVHGVSGQRFITPFASPPCVGESSPLLNVIWGMANFVIGYWLVFGVGKFAFGFNLGVLMVGLGIVGTAICLALYFERVRGR
jgi:hypothetical protein